MKKIKTDIFRPSKTKKRIVSIALSFTILTGSVPMGYWADGFGILGRKLTVLAAGTGTGYSFSDLGTFKAYVTEYNSDPAAHKNDILTFTFGGSSTNQEFECESMGQTQEAAFDGKIILGTGMQFNMVNSLFKYVTDDVEIVDSGGAAATMVFTRPRPGDNAPLFAENVIHSRESGDPVEWKFEYTTYNSGNYRYTYNAAGFIGTLGSNANVKLSSVSFNNTGVGSDGTLKADIVSNSAGDAGLVCGTMSAGSQLEIDSVSSLTDESADKSYSITASGTGNAGGLVGSMASGSELLLGNALECFQAPDASITSTGGYAGGIVGKCDGGVIGIAEDSASVTPESGGDEGEPEETPESDPDETPETAVKYTVSQNITGGSGSGGVAGYYKAVTDNSSENAAFSTDIVDLGTGSFKVNGGGACGGLFGEVFNNGTDMAITVDGKVKPDHTTGTAASYGGLIGKYYASAQTLSLTVSGTETIEPHRTEGDAANYGGVIGIVDKNGNTSAYVKIYGITVNSKNANVGGFFGGVIARADEAFIELAAPDSGNNTISYSGIAADKNFAGVVGSLESGVLYLCDGTDLSGAATIASATAKSGQIVGYRNCGFVFAKSGWKLYRSTVGQKVDDIGSWGEVIRFNDSTFQMSNVITFDSTSSNHYLTIKKRTQSNYHKDILNTEDFAILALNAQFNNGADGNVLKFEDLNNFKSSVILTGKDISFKNAPTIDLRGTGITGLTRDNSYNGSDTTSFLEFKKNINGNGATIILAIGEEYGESHSSSYGNGTIYRHQYNGLLAKVNNGTINAGSPDASAPLYISNLSEINVESCIDNMNVGSLVACASGQVTINRVETKIDATSGEEHPKLVINHAGNGKNFYIGGFIGKAENNVIIYKNQPSKFDGTIQDNGNASSAIVGGLVGYISANTFASSIKNATVSGNIKSTGSAADQKIGGLIGVIGGSGNSNARTLALENVTVSGLNVEGTATNSSGGLLGYNWFKTDVTFGNGTTVKGVEVTSSTMKSTAPNTAGLVYEASGYWKVQTVASGKEGIRITSAAIDAANAASFGGIINKGAYSSSAIYLELAQNSYKIASLTTTALNSSVGVFDELVAYSKFDGKDICDNGQGIVSINVGDELKMGSDDTNTGVTYQNQSGFAPTSYCNPNTRYYYNLDNYRERTTNSVAEKFLMWSVWQYAHSSIQGYFPVACRFESGAIGAANADLDMRGYSYYPVDVSGTVKISGNVKLYNSEFDATENGTVCKRKSLGTTPASQHYTMHNSLFRNVTGSLTAASLKLDGNVSICGGTNDSADYCGTLVMGTVESSNSAKPATVTVNGLTLNGIRINSPGSNYAPLLINKSGSNATFVIKDISGGTKTENSAAVSVYGTNDIIASSLIGNLGSKDATSVKVSFENIRLDGRNASGAGTDGLNSVYYTNRSLFSRATLLNSLAYSDNSSYGRYYYAITEDWSGSTKVGNVTYGAEIVASVENSGKQNKYNGSNYYTHPTNHNEDSSQYAAFETKYQKYVYTGYDTDPDKRTHELRVNITSVSFGGCGTYNDPYVIVSGENLETIAKIINGTWSGNFTISVPDTVMDSTQNADWCAGSSDHHKTFTSYTKVEGNRDTSLWSTGGSSPDTLMDSLLAKYLAGAYYQISDDLTSDITLSKDFAGFSNNVADAYVFHGVIDGNGKTIINESSNPLIVSSKGSVVRELTITVKPYSVKKINKDKDWGANSSKGFKSTDDSCEFYGAVIGQIISGDNIIEKVSVGFAANPTSGNGCVVDANSASHAKLVPIGGYVGVILDGGLIFKKMDGNTVSRTGITKDQLTNFDTDPLTSEAYLYINPIIGRVINGYAVTERTEYHWSETAGERTDTNGVTMHNGCKNYSIADVKSDYTAAEKLTIAQVNGRATVKFPNAQSMFILSLLTQSSMTANVFRGYKHNADYDEIGTSAVNTGDYASVAATYPYLVKNYVNPDSQASIATLTSGSTAYDFSLGGTDTAWYLPDGFRGIGSIGWGLISDTDMNDRTLNDRTFSLHRFSGKGSYGAGEAISINMNTSVKHYAADVDNYLPINTKHGGLGLFNKFRQYNSGTSDNPDKISDLNLSGKINYDVQGVTNYTSANVHKDAYLHVGGLAGCIGSGEDTDTDLIRVEQIGIDGLEINGFESAGGFFGYLLMANLASGEVNITNVTSTSAFTITSKRYAGGLIGYFGQGNLTISDVTITSPNVLSYFIGNAYQDFENGVGGVIGFAQNYSDAETTFCDPIEMSNIKIGALDTTNTNRIGYVEANTGNFGENQDTIVAGGIIGRSNTKPQNAESAYTLKLDTCNVCNINIYGHRVGGLIGSDTGTKSTGNAGTDNLCANSIIQITNCKVESDNDSIIYGKPYKYRDTKHRACGGMIGGVRTNGVYISSCVVKGYTLQSEKDTGGITAHTEKGQVTLNDIVIKDVKIISDYSGCLVGWQNVPINGYNILADNVQFKTSTGSANLGGNVAYAIGKHNSEGNAIKIVCFSRQNITPKTGFAVPDRMTGTGSTASHGSGTIGDGNKTKSFSYGGGYVIFSDYNGTASDTGFNTSFSDNSNTNALTAVTDSAYDESPYVMVNPKKAVSNTQFFTGDGVSSSAYGSSAAKSIITHIDGGTNAKRYQSTGISAENLTMLKSLLPNKISSFAYELGKGNISTASADYSGKDFPVLVIDDISNVDPIVKNYIRLLTNTSYNFYKKKESNNIEKIYTIEISKWKYSQTNGVFEKQSGDAALKYDNDHNEYYILATEWDNVDYQFSLIDVAFKDPSATTTTAYHLYIPVMVEKMLYYDVNLRPASGTTYQLSAYPDGETNLIENLGNPVTMRLTYIYDQASVDWAKAINNGESVQRNYSKSVMMKVTHASGATGFPTDAKIVLVDPNHDADKMYYADFSPANTALLQQKPGTSSEYTNYNLNLGGFSGFTVCTMNDLMKVSTDSAATERNLVECAAGETPTVIINDPDDVNNGKRLRVKTGSGTGEYAVKVSDWNGRAFTKVEEDYYLSIFTKPAEEDDTIYHYEFDSDTSFRDPAYPSARMNDEVSHILIGNLYNNEITAFSDDNTNTVISTSNNCLEATLTAQVGFKGTAIDSNIIGYIQGNENVKIYQTFLVALQKIKDDLTNLGIVLTPECSFEYYVNGTRIDETEEKECKDLGAYVEFPTSHSIKDALCTSALSWNSAQNNEDDCKITIMAKVRMSYAKYDIESLVEQFPESTGSDGNGTIMVGYSNISSSYANGSASSESYNTLSDNNNRRLYYMDNIKPVSLSYMVSENAGFLKNGKDGNVNFGQLGINAQPDANEITGGVSSINSLISFNASEYTLRKDAEFMQIKVKLSSKNDEGNYADALSFSTYFKTFKLFDKNNTEIKNNVLENTTLTIDPDTNIHTYVIPLSALKSMGEGSYEYEVPVNFEVYTGENEKFQGANLKYANYRVHVEVSLLDENQDDLRGSWDEDWIIYTNSRIYRDIITDP